MSFVFGVFDHSLAVFGEKNRPKRGNVFGLWPPAFLMFAALLVFDFVLPLFYFFFSRFFLGGAAKWVGPWRHTFSEEGGSL